MKKIYSRKTFLTLVIIAAGICTVTAQETLAKWSFDQWPGGGAAGAANAGIVITDPILANIGTQVTSAKIGSEYMFADARVLGTEVIRAWGTPTAAGYVRTAGMLIGTYYRIIGLTTVGYTSIKVSGGFAADSSSRYYYLQLQYRDGSTGTWVSLGDPVFINNVNETNIPLKFDNVQLPVAAEGVTALEIRFLQTAFDGTAITTQSRLDNISVTGVKVISSTNINKTDNVKVFNANGKLAISNAAGANVTIYNLMGSKIKELKNIQVNEETVLPIGQTYIVKVNNKAFKVLLN